MESLVHHMGKIGFISVTSSSQRFKASIPFHGPFTWLLRHQLAIFNQNSKWLRIDILRRIPLSHLLRRILIQRSGFARNAFDSISLNSSYSLNVFVMNFQWVVMNDSFLHMLGSWFRLHELFLVENFGLARAGWHLLLGAFVVELHHVLENVLELDVEESLILIMDFGDLGWEKLSHF